MPTLFRTLYYQGLATRPLPRLMWRGFSQVLCTTVLVVESARLSRLRFSPEAVLHRDLEPTPGESGIGKRARDPRRTTRARRWRFSLDYTHRARSPAQTGCFRSFANVRAWGTSFRTLSAGSLCCISKERAEDSEAGRSRRSAWYEGLCAIGRIGRQTRVAESSSPHYERRFRAPERLFSRVRVEVQTMITNMRGGNRIVTIVTLGKGLGAAALRGHAEGVSILLGQRGLQMADLLLD